MSYLSSPTSMNLRLTDVFALWNHPSIILPVMYPELAHSLQSTLTGLFSDCEMKPDKKKNRQNSP